jgi:hypothetical protein
MWFPGRWYYGVKLLLEIGPFVLVRRGSRTGIRLLIWIHRLVGLYWLAWTVFLWLIGVAFTGEYGLQYLVLLVFSYGGYGILAFTVIPNLFYRKSLREPDEDADELKRYRG